MRTTKRVYRAHEGSASCPPYPGSRGAVRGGADGDGRGDGGRESLRRTHRHNHGPATQGVQPRSTSPSPWPSSATTPG